MVPMNELLNKTKEYSCDRSLFSFVNRSLREYGMMAFVNRIEDDQVSFRVIDRKDN